jgi:hypothetical protein
MYETKPGYDEKPETLRFLNKDERNERTPGRKLTKDDISTTSVLIRGCSTQDCCGTGPLTGDGGGN